MNVAHNSCEDSDLKKMITEIAVRMAGDFSCLSFKQKCASLGLFIVITETTYPYLLSETTRLELKYSTVQKF